MSDVLFSVPVAMSAKIINSINTSPVYQYNFNFEAPFGSLKSLFNFEKGKLI